VSRYDYAGLESHAATDTAGLQESPQPVLMSVEEMGRVLGLKKTERYWLIHKNVFDTRIFARKTWIIRDSFEKWYANQARYHKVDGEPPGRVLKEFSYSPEDIACMLKINVSTVYEIIKREQLETVTVDHSWRVRKESYDSWYASQDKYRNAQDRKMDKEILKKTVSMPEMARLLGIRRSNVYSILKSKQYGHFFESVVIAGQKRITWESLDAFLAGQEKYHLYYPADKKGKVPEKNGKLANFRKKAAMNEEDTRPIGTTDYLTIDEAAAVAEVSRFTIYSWLEKGCFPVKRAGRTVRVQRTDFEAWLNKRTEEQPAGQPEALTAKSKKKVNQE